MLSRLTNFFQRFGTSLKAQSYLLRWKMLTVDMIPNRIWQK